MKENAEYHAAKEEQAKIESRVIEINDLIARANVVDVTKLEKKDNVIFGSTVSLINLENNEKKTYKIVGKDEADITKNYIYFRSPIGKALIGKKKGIGNSQHTIWWKKFWNKRSWIYLIFTSFS